VIKCFDLCVEFGEIVGIVGESGLGKSFMVFMLFDLFFCGVVVEGLIWFVG